MSAPDRGRSGGRPSRAGRRLLLAGRPFAVVAVLALPMTSMACSAPLPSRPAGTAGATATSTPPPATAPSSPGQASSATASPVPPSAQGPASLLVVLDVTDGRTAIDAYPLDAPPFAVPPPAGELQWLAADGRGRLVATRIDGRLVPATRPSLVDPAWAEPGIVAPGDSPPLSFGVPDATGGRTASLVAAYGSGATSGLDLRRTRAPILARSSPIETGLEANGAAPAWLGGDVVLAGLAADGTPATVIVDTTTAAVLPGPKGARAVASSADGSRVAVVGTDQRTIAVTEATAWLSSGAAAASSGLALSEPAGVVAGLALDATGRSLAVVWTGPDLLPAVVVRYDEAGGWQERERIALRAGTVRAAVTWVPENAGPPR